jgi:hypothetical protein
VEFGGLAPGLYELTVSAEESGPGAPPPVHAAFEVVEAQAVE